MDIKLENLENSKVKFEVRVDKNIVDDEIKKTYKKNINKYSVPGFRKGKVPFNIAKQYYGIEVLLQDAISNCVNNSYAETIDENKLNPVEKPQIEIMDMGQDKDLVYSVEVTVKPEVNVSNYKGIEVKKEVIEVTEDEMNTILNSVAEKNARFEIKGDDEQIEDGDIAKIDFKGYIDGIAFEGGEGKDYSLTIGSKSFIGDFEDQLIGLKTLENKDVKVKFPEEYGNPDLNGKEALFEVTIKEIKKKILPEINDDLIQDISEFNTLEEFKEDEKKKMLALKESSAKSKKEQMLIDKACENAELYIPEVMIENEIDSMVDNFANKIMNQGMTLEKYYEYTNTDSSSMREMMREGAEKKVRTDLVLEKIGEVEKIEVTDEEIEQRAEDVAAHIVGDKTNEISKFKNLILKNQKHIIEFDIKIQKVIDFLVNNSMEIE